MREELGISMMVNPDYNAANEIAKVLRYPEAINIESFAKGRVDLAEIRITSGSILDGVALSHLTRRLRLDVLICAVQRGDELLIPNGNFTLRSGDKIHMTASHSNMVKFFKSISAAYREKRVKSAVLIGGGRVAYHLAQQLIEMGVKVKIIEIDKNRCLFSFLTASIRSIFRVLTVRITIFSERSTFTTQMRSLRRRESSRKIYSFRSLRRITA